MNTKVDNFLIAIRYQPEQSSVAVSISCKMQNKVCGILGNYNKNPYDIENPKRAEGRPWNHPARGYETHSGATEITLSVGSGYRIHFRQYVTEKCNF